MMDVTGYIKNVWLNWDKIYLARPDNIPLLFVGLPFLIIFFISIWYLRTRRRIEKTHGSRYSKLMDMKLWLGMILVYGLTSFAAAKPMIAKRSLETSLGPVEAFFLVDLSLSSHSKYFGETGPTALDIAKSQIRAIEPTLTSTDQASIIYFAKNAYEAHPMFPLNESIRPLFNKAIDEISLPKKLNVITTYNPTLNFVDSSNIISALVETYKLYDKTQKFRDPNYKVSSQKNRLIFILSDGDFSFDDVADQPAEGQASQDPQKVLAAALRELKKRGMSIYPIGIGTRSGVPLIDTLKKYKKGVDYDEAYEKAIIEKGLTRLNPSSLMTLVGQAGGNPSKDIFLIDNRGADAYDFMNLKIISHRQKDQAKTVESRNDEPLWKSVVLVAIGFIALSLVGWKVFSVSMFLLYFFGGFIISHVPIIPWIGQIVSAFVKSLN